MAIYEQENALFDEWEKEVQGLVRDGAGDEYNNAKLKTVFILKETNNAEDGFDLREFLSYGAIPQTWDTVARWAEGLSRIDEELLWEDLERENDERRKEYLPKICAINLKKTSGGHSANNTELYDAAKRDSAFLKRQLEIYNPDIIIICGMVTEDFFYKHVYNDKEYPGLRTSRGIWYVNSNGRIIVTYVHPDLRQYKNTEWVFYYGLIDAVKEILVNGERGNGSN